MAKQTQQEWLAKIKKFVPSWWFEKHQYNDAVFGAVAAVFAQIDADSNDSFNTTFILNASGAFLDMLGDERGIDRLPGELDYVYARRIQKITSQTDVESIRKAVDSILLVPGCMIIDSPPDNPYCNRGSFISRGLIMTGFLENFFTIIIPKQSHPQYSFANRQIYANRMNFIGSSSGTADRYASIIAIVDYMKAFGVLYRVIESKNSVLV